MHYQTEGKMMEHKLEFLVSKDLKNKIVAAADNMGVKRATWLRMVARKAADEAAKAQKGGE